MIGASSCYVFFNDTATTEIYTLSLHDALPISARRLSSSFFQSPGPRPVFGSAPLQTSRLPVAAHRQSGRARSEEHTSELQSRQYLVCRLLLEKIKFAKHHS